MREVRDCREVELDKRRRKWEWDRMREERRRVRRLMNQSKERQKMERRASEAKTVRQGIEGKLHSGDDGSTLPEADEQAIAEDDDEDDGASIGDSEDDFDEEDPTEWQPGEGVEVDYAAIVSILVRHLDVQGELHLLDQRDKDSYSPDPLRDR